MGNLTASVHLKLTRLIIYNYNEAIEVEPDSADAYYYRADEYLQKGEVKTALNDYNQVILLNPNYSSI